MASRGRDATCATLSSWATASNFPSAWAKTDVIALTQALRTLAVVWGEEFQATVNPTLAWLEEYCMVPRESSSASSGSVSLGPG